MSEIAGWLRKIGLGKYVGAFADHEIDLEILPKLSEQDLRDIGLPLGPLRKLQQAIAGTGLQPESTPGPGEEVAPEGERRQVTVLFADLTDFTKLSHELDAEDTHTLLNRYFAVVDGIVEKYGGAIDKHIGDNVMAVFGAPVAHTDDPERAVRAAIDIHTAMAALSEELDRTLTAHIGIASGPVVASETGSQAHREYTVTGDTVNLAARLDDIAEPGETLVSKAIHDAVAPVASCASRGDVTIKGFANAVQVWLVEKLSDDSQSNSRSEFVGRRIELRQFTAGLEVCKEQSRGHTVLVRGEPGIGKTRMVEEFAASARDHAFVVHKVLVLDFGVGKGQDAIRALVRSLLAILPGSDKDTRRAAANQAIVEGRVQETQRVFLNDLLDLPQPADLLSLYGAMDNETRNRGKQAALSQLLVARAKTEPRLVIIEDIHWADKVTHDHLANLASSVADCAAVLIMTTRIEGKAMDHGWLATLRGSPLTTMELQPLHPEEAARFAQGLGQGVPELIEKCVARSEGNPLFLEQLVRNISDKSGDELPDTLQGLVLAQMDRLSARDHEALQAASVMGQRFSLEALRNLLQDDSYDCHGLLEHRLIRPEGSQFLFAHALIRDGVYASLLLARRRELHARAAEWFAEIDPVLNAEHLDRAESPHAAAAYLETARTQAALYHFERAVSLILRGKEIAQNRETKLELAKALGDLLHDKGDLGDSTAAYREALTLVESDSERCGVLIGLASVMRLTDEYESALGLLETAQAIGEAQGFTLDLSKLHHLRGNLYFPLGRIDECFEEHGKALSYARQAGSTEYEALALGGLGDAEYARCRLLTAHGHFLECLKLSGEQGYARIEVANLHMIGGIYFYMNDLEKALEAGIAGAEKGEKIGHVRATAVSHIEIFKVYFETRDLNLAEQHLSRSKELIWRIGIKRFMARALHQEGCLRLAAGENRRAADLFRQAMAISRESGITYCGPLILASLARAVSDPAERNAAMEEGEQLLAQGCVSHNYLEFYIDAMELAHHEGDWQGIENHAAALEEYTSVEPMPRTDFFIARGRALASFGRGNRGKAVVEDLKRLRDEARRVGLRGSLPALEEAL